MVSPTDPNEVRLTGENSFIRLHDGEGGPMLTRSSHWRVLHSPGGAGHVLFIKSDLTNDDVKIYADNIALARWLQEEIESMLFPEFADQNIPVIAAEFEREGDTFTYWTESVESDEERILLTWHDFLEPFMITVPPRSGPRKVTWCVQLLYSRAERSAYPEQHSGSRGASEGRPRWSAKQQLCIGLVGNVGAPILVIGQLPL